MRLQRCTLCAYSIYVVHYHVIQYIHYIQARLTRFAGASAISSADYYGEGESGGGGAGGGGGGVQRMGSDSFDFNTSDLMNKLSIQVNCLFGSLTS